MADGTPTRLIDATTRASAAPSDAVGEDGRAVAATPSLQQEWEFLGSPRGIASINVAVGWHFSEALEIATTQRAFDEIVRRHEALRTYVALHEGRIAQVVRSHACIQVRYVDLRHLQAKKRWRTIVRSTNASLRSPFSLRRLPLVRPTLYRVGAAENVLQLVLAHTVWDAGSMDVFVREFAALYAAFLEGHRSPLPALIVQYPDVAHWDRYRSPCASYPARRSELVDRQWSIALPLRDERTRSQGHRPAVEPIPLIPPWAVKRLDSLAQECGASPAASVLAAVSLALRTVSRDTQLVLGFQRASRDTAEKQAMIGYLAENILVEVDLSGDPTFRGLVGRAGMELADTYAHELTMSTTFPESEGKGPWRGEATCAVMLNYLAADWTQFREPHALRLSPQPLQTPKWFNLFPVATLWDFGVLDLSLQRHDAGGGIDGRLGYNITAVAPSLVWALVRDLGRLMRLAALRPDSTLSWLIERTRDWQVALPAEAFNWPRLDPGAADRSSP